MRKAKMDKASLFLFLVQSELIVQSREHKRLAANISSMLWQAASIGASRLPSDLSQAARDYVLLPRPPWLDGGCTTTNCSWTRDRPDPDSVRGGM